MRFEYSVKGLVGTHTGAIRAGVVNGLREGEGKDGKEEKERGLVHLECV